jgi:serine/threonine protein kinase SCH9
MVERHPSRDDSPPESLDEQGQKRKLEDLPETVPTKLPPTPISSASSFLQRDGPAATNGQPETEAAVNPVAQALKNFVLSSSSLKSRRHASLPVSSVTVGPVIAAHISNPSTFSHQTAPGSPAAPVVEEDVKLHDSASVQELIKLTSSVADGSRLKNTPPLTPRALSHEEGYQGKRSPLSSGTSMTPDVKKSPDLPPIKTKSPPRNNEALPTGSPKGKLSVKIDEARGLKPSYDPYVVCVFEWNEYISNGPRHDAMDIDHDGASSKKSRKDTISAKQIRRTDDDTGKPKAIPMRSRQSSNNGEMDSTQSRSNSFVTDPQWDHEAML